MTAISAGAEAGATPARRDTGGGRPRGRRWAAWAAALAPVGVVVLAVSAVVVGAVSLVGDAWEPMNDWSALVTRVAQVGGPDTPLVGPYSFHGFAHPGPLLYWLAAPAYRLSGGETRAVLWTGAAVHVAAVVAVAAVAWRRGRWPLLLATMATAAQLVHGIGTRVLVDLWNPYVALLPFLLTVVLAWDVALGHRRALVPLVVAGTFTMQCHLAFVPLVAVVGLWCAWWSRRDRPDPPDPPDPPDRPGGWRPVARPALVVAGLLWAGPVVDAVVGWHNPARTLRSLAHPGDTVGPIDALTFVGRYVRPDGWWARGGEVLEPVGGLTADALVVPLLAVLLAACGRAARRRGLGDAAALSSLALALVLAAVPATSRLAVPTPDYLTEWVKVVGAVTWLAVGWTGWRLLDARRTAAAAAGEVGARLRVGVALAAVATVAVLVGAPAATWSPATGTQLPPGDHIGVADRLREAAHRGLDPDLVYRIELVGDLNVHHSALIRPLIEEGFTILTGDGVAGQKWGPSQAWERDDHVDVTLTLAVDVPRDPSARFARCATDARVRRVFATGGLTPSEQVERDSLGFRSLESPDALTEEERRRARYLDAQGVEIALYAGDHVCGGRPEADELE